MQQNRLRAIRATAETRQHRSIHTTRTPIPTGSINTPTPIDGQLVIGDDDRTWPAMFESEAAQIPAALGGRALRIEHMGSTSGPGLPAKPCIDILLAVADSADEPAYVPDLAAAGFVLRFREPASHEHRIFRRRRINLNLHVWSEGSPETECHLRFREWLRTHDDGRDRYAAARRELATRHWKTMSEYAEAKNAIVAEITAWMEEAG